MTVEDVKLQAAKANGGGHGAKDQFPVGMRVLAVDDDPTCLKLLEKLLQHCQYHVTTTGQAATALKLLREKKDQFDLVISDVHMPDMDGFKLLELVGLEMDLPVIMLSANGETQTVMKGITHGACDYLLKPVRIEQLRTIWQHVVRRRSCDAKNNGNDNDDSGKKLQVVSAEGDNGGGRSGAVGAVPAGAQLRPRAVPVALRRDDLHPEADPAAGAPGVPGEGGRAGVAGRDRARRVRGGVQGAAPRGAGGRRAPLHRHQEDQEARRRRAGHQQQPQRRGEPAAGQAVAADPVGDPHGGPHPPPQPAAAGGARAAPGLPLPGVRVHEERQPAPRAESRQQCRRGRGRRRRRGRRHRHLHRNLRRAFVAGASPRGGGRGGGAGVPARLPPAADHPPGPEAGQHPAGRRPGAPDRGLRAGQGDAGLAHARDGVERGRDAGVHRAGVLPDGEVHGQVRRVQLRGHPGGAGHGEGAVRPVLHGDGGGGGARQVAAPRHGERGARAGHRPGHRRRRTRRADPAAAAHRALLHQGRPQGAAHRQGRPLHALADQDLATQPPQSDQSLHTNYYPFEIIS